MLVGIFQFLQGLVAAFNDKDFFVVTDNFIFALNPSAWGWIHMILGIAVAVAGLFILRGNAAARFAGLVIAFFQAVVNFLWLPHYPVWAILIIALDVLIIWSLVTVRLNEV